MIARLNVGGPAYHVAALTSGLDPRRFESLLVAGRVGPGEASLADVVDAYGGRLEYVEALGPELRPLSDLRALLRLIGVVRRFRPDVVDTHTAKAGMLGRVAARFLRPRPAVVHTYHGHVLSGYFGPRTSGFYRMLETGLARLSDRLITVSAATADDLAARGVAPRGKFLVVPVGLDLEPFLTVDEAAGAGIREELGVGRDEVLAVYAGRLVPIKRIDVLLNALATARAAGSPVRLALVGDGPDRHQLEELARELGLAHAVRFLGYRRDVPAIAAAADLGVLSSDNEGTPVALIELAAAGRPAAATDVGGVRDVVAADCGRLVPPGDADALGAAIAELAGDRGLRDELGRSAREHVRHRFTRERMLREVTACFDELAERRTRRS